MFTLRKSVLSCSFKTRSISRISSVLNQRVPFRAILWRPKAHYSTSSNPSSFSTLAREYGPVAVVVYFGLAFPTFCGCLYAITYMGVTKDEIQAVFDKIKTALGIPLSAKEEVKPGVDSNHSWDWLPAWAKTEQATTIATNILLAMGMTKLFAPIKFGLVGMIVPPLGRFLKSRGWILGNKSTNH
jgi:hypothetical protein